MTQLIEKAKARFYKMVDDYGSDPYELLSHVTEMERWANYMLKKHSQADKDVVLLSVWLHDIGHYPIKKNIDHAVRGEKRAKEFLKKMKCPKDKIDKVLHCIRSHRCRDVMPASFEAKIIAFIDSASHLTWSGYMGMSIVDKNNKQEFRAYAKMDRDYKDLSAFPAIQKKMKGLYKAWKKLIKEYEKLELE